MYFAFHNVRSFVCLGLEEFQKTVFGGGWVGWFCLLVFIHARMNAMLVDLDSRRIVAIRRIIAITA
jgi:hypothetical protein